VDEEAEEEGKLLLNVFDRSNIRWKKAMESAISEGIPLAIGCIRQRFLEMRFPEAEVYAIPKVNQDVYGRAKVDFVAKFHFEGAQHPDTLIYIVGRESRAEPKVVLHVLETFYVSEFHALVYSPVQREIGWVGGTALPCDPDESALRIGQTLATYRRRVAPEDKFHVLYGEVYQEPKRDGKWRDYYSRVFNVCYTNL
jgi:hypothetical protein